MGFLMTFPLPLWSCSTHPWSWVSSPSTLLLGYGGTTTSWESRGNCGQIFLGNALVWLWTRPEGLYRHAGLWSCWKLFQPGTPCSAEPWGEKTNFVLGCTATGMLDSEGTTINGVKNRLFPSVKCYCMLENVLLTTMQLTCNSRW